MDNLVKLFLVFWAVFAPINCAKIIALQPMTSKSQKNVFRPLVHELASKGHDVTWVYCFPENQVVPSVKTIEIKENVHVIEFLQKQLFDIHLKNGQAFVLSTIVTKLTQTVEGFVNHSQIQTLMKNGKQYDVAIVNSFINDVTLMASTHLAKHVISLSPANFALYSKASPPIPLSTFPVHTFPIPMDFISRMKNAVLGFGIWNVFKYFTHSVANDLGHQKYPYLPSVSEAMDQVALFLTNSDLVTSVAKPGVSNHIDIGGISCKPPKVLPKEFSDFIDSSGEDGFILFSLGSIVQAKYMPENIRLAFVNAFARLKQKVIWKFEEKMENVPDNVMLTSWAPQQDLLGHPKIRLFMTHGGILSSQETIFHGVPVIGIPIMGDQPLNVWRLREIGLGENLEISNISSEIVYSTIQKVLQDPSYKTNMKKYSAIMRDQAQHSLHRAIYWIEYLVRHNGAEHLASSAMHLDYYQYHSLDIIAILLSLMLFTIYLCCKITKFMIRKFSDAKRLKQD